MVLFDSPLAESLAADAWYAAALRAAAAEPGPDAATATAEDGTAS
jgi:hypothetical protein